MGSPRSPRNDLAPADGVYLPKHTNPAEFAVVMGFEAFRICVGQPTKHYPPEEVFRWMRTMLKAAR